jgi:hypothetical protein
LSTTHAGAAAIAKGLAQSAEIVNVDITNNQIGDAGARAFGEMLAVNKVLMGLSLGDNEIGDDGKLKLSFHFMIFPSIHRWILSGFLKLYGRGRQPVGCCLLPTPTTMF